MIVPFKRGTISSYGLDFPVLLHKANGTAGSVRDIARCDLYCFNEAGMFCFSFYCFIRLQSLFVGFSDIFRFDSSISAATSNPLMFANLFGVLLKKKNRRYRI
jgi:hypothetical protein